MKTFLHLIFFFFSIICLPAFSQKNVWQWINTFGSSQWDIVNDITCDSSGNIYATGSFTDTFKYGNDSLVSIGSNDAFVVKLDSTGKYKWMIQQGDSAYDFASCIIATGKYIYVAGSFENTCNFGKTKISSSGTNLFLACFDSLGQVSWVKSFQGSFGNYIHSLSIDKKSNIIACGTFNGVLHFGKDSITSTGKNDGFVVQFNKKGDLIWIRQIGGIHDDIATKVSVDRKNNIYFTGTFKSEMRIGTKIIRTTKNNENIGVFIISFTNAGELMKAGVYGEAKKITSPRFVCGKKSKYFLSYNFEDKLYFENKVVASHGYDDIIMAGFNDTLSLLWYRQIGGEGMDRICAITVNHNNELVLAGTYTQETNIDSTSIDQSSGWGDIFIAQFSDTKNILWVQKAGSKGDDYPRAVVTDRNDNIYLAGSFSDTLNIRNGTLISKGDEDIFIGKIFNCEQKKLIINGDTVICKGSFTKLTATKGFDYYNWNNGLSYSNNILAGDEGIYNLLASDTLGCVAYGSFKIKEAPLPSIELGNDTTLYILDSISLNPKVGNNINSFEWFDKQKIKNRTIKAIKLGEGTHDIWLNVTDENKCSNSDTVKVTVKKTIKKDTKKTEKNKTDELLADAIISIFPNPASTNISWAIDNSFDNLSVMLVDLTGRILINCEITGYTKYSLKMIDVSALARGTCYLKISTNKVERLEKVILQ